MTIRCSDLARSGGEPLAGTAPYARAWVALEQPGPWGARALTASRLDPAVGRALTDRTADLPVTVVLIRRPGHHADLGRSGPRTVLVAHTGPGRPWLEQGVVDDPATLIDLDLAALADGVRPRVGPLVDGSVLLVCTNSRRDACCALRGRPAVAELSATRPGRVWESSHLGGHRFAPTVLSLPDGFVFGGPGATRLDLASCRGRTALAAPAQAAELAVLAGLSGLAGAPRALAVSEGAEGRFRVADGARTWPVLVRAEALADRPESCGKPAVPAVAHRAVVEASV